MRSGAPFTEAEQQGEAMQGEPVIDVAAVMERIGGDRGLLEELVELYLGDEQRLLASISAALDAGDAAAVQRAAHTLKGAVSNFGAPRAMAAALAMEAAGREGRIEEARLHFPSLQSAFTLVREALTQSVRTA